MVHDSGFHPWSHGSLVSGCGEAEPSGGKCGWSKTDGIVVARERGRPRTGRRKERPGTSCTLPGHVASPHKTPPLNSISSMSESLQDTS